MVLKQRKNIGESNSWLASSAISLMILTILEWVNMEYKFYLVRILRNVYLQLFVRNARKKLKVLSLKCAQKMEEIVPLKSVFRSSRYLDPSPRYKASKSITLNAGLKNEWWRHLLTYIF